MNRTEAVMLLTYIARVDHRNFDREDAAVFAELLDDITLADALDAAKAHLRSDNRWLTAALIRGRVEAANGGAPSDATVDESLLVPDADPDDVPAYCAALRAGRYRPQGRVALTAPMNLNAITAGRRVEDEIA